MQLQLHPHLGVDQVEGQLRTFDRGRDRCQRQRRRAPGGRGVHPEQAAAGDDGVTALVTDGLHMQQVRGVVVSRWVGVAGGRLGVWKRGEEVSPAGRGGEECAEMLL